MLVIQFREDAYDPNIVEKITLGSQLRGRLAFVDRATGQILAEQRVEGVKHYDELLGLIRGHLAAALLKSFPPPAQRSEAVTQALNGLPAIKPGTQDILRSS